jgi:tetratricopeptide (TPR) repeat protein
MLKFVTRIREFFEIRRMIASARRDRSPLTTVKLCRHLERTHRYQAAIREAQAGLERFPHAHQLEDILRSSFERHAAAKERASGKSGIGLAELCELVQSYAGFAKLDDAARGARELIARFPREPRALILHGTVFKSLFQRDHASRDGQAAIDSFRKAVMLDPTSLEARRTLAETYALIGATSQAVFHALLALEIDPRDPATNRLYGSLRRKPLSSRNEKDLLWEAEVHDQPIEAKKDVPADITSNALVLDGVKRLSEMPSVKRVAARHHGIAIVATRERMRPASVESDPFLKAIDALRRSASTWAKRVNVGGFEEATLTLQGASVFAVAGGGTVVALELMGEDVTGRVAEEARNLLASWTAKEPVVSEWVR